MDDSSRILYISEILRVVLDDLTDDKRTVVSLAYTSKAVSDIALDYLWADMDSFAPFVPLLPKPIQEIWVGFSQYTLLRMLRCHQDATFNIAILPLIKCPPAEEWKRFDIYAYRVRRIRPREDYLDRALYQRLVSIRTGVDIFPRVSALRCHLFDPLIPDTKIFPSSLRSLSLYPEYALLIDGRAELALRQAAHDAPYLEEIYIVGIYRLHPGTTLRPLDFKKLRKVHLVANILRPADLRSFLHLLSASPILNLGISVRSSSEVAFKLGDTGVQPSILPYMKNIYICDGPRRAAGIISQICSPCLKSVTIEHRDRFASIPEYGCFFTLLAQRHPPIYALEVKMGRVYVSTRNEYVRGFLATLEPLVHAGLAKLRVEMSLCGACKIEEDVKKRLRGEAWPSLSYFEFVLTEALTFGH